MRVPLCALLVVIVLLFCVPSGMFGNPVSMPAITVSIDGVPISFPLTITDFGNAWAVDGTDVLRSGSALSGIVSLSGMLEPNPFLSYSFSVTNATTATHNYSVQFVIAPPAGTQYYRANSGYSATIQDGAHDGVTMGLPSGQTHMQTLSASPPGNLGIHLGNMCTWPGGGNTVCPGGALATTAFSPTTFATLNLVLSFTLTGGRDYASVLGSADLIPVPEPETWFLFACGLLMVSVTGMHSLLRKTIRHLVRH